jgi:hypothetical protein
MKFGHGALGEQHVGNRGFDDVPARIAGHRRGCSDTTGERRSTVVALVFGVAL